MKVFMIGVTSSFEFYIIIKEFIFDTMEVENPDFSKSHRNCYDGDVFDYKYFKTEKEAVKEFLKLIDDSKYLYDERLLPKNTDEMYHKVYKLAKRKYPEVLI